MKEWIKLPECEHVTDYRHPPWLPKGAKKYHTRLEVPINWIGKTGTKYPMTHYHNASTGQSSSSHHPLPAEDYPYTVEYTPAKPLVWLTKTNHNEDERTD